MIDNQSKANQIEQKVFESVFNELRRSTQMFPSFNSMHEGYSVILEELD